MTGMSKIPAGYKQTEVGVIPEEWELVPLDRVSKRGSGHTPDKKHPEYWNGEIRWVSLADSDRLDQRLIEETVHTISAKGIEHSSAVIHPEGTVVLSRDAGVGKSAVMASCMAVSQHFMAWRCGTTLSNFFLYYYLQKQKGEFERIANGSTIKTIGLPFFREYRIPLPPLPEQKRIAQVLGDVDALIQKLETLIAKKRNIKQAAMQELLTGKRRLPGFSGPWETKKLGDVTTISMGRTPPTGNPKYWGAGYVWLSIADMRGKVLAASKSEVTQAALKLMTRVSKGTLLMSFKLSIGRLGFAGHDLFTNEAICAFNNPKENPEYMYYALHRTDFSLYGKQAVKGFTLNSASLRSVELYFPPLPEQTAIAQVLSDMDAELAQLESRLAKTRDMKAGLMQELLTGRIRLV